MQNFPFKRLVSFQLLSLCNCAFFSRTGQTQPLLHPFKYRQRRVSFVTQFLRNASTNSLNQKFSFRKVLIVTKLSRYEFEQHKNPKLSVVQLEKLLRDRGTDYDLWLHYHQIHKEFERRVAKSFKEHGMDVKLVNR